MNNILVITREDKLITLEEWQKIYGLTAHGTQIGKYFCYDEPIPARDLRDYGKLYVSELLIRVLDAFRLKVNRPLHINSFNRSDAKQAQLRKDGLRAATTSPHVVFLAADIDTKSPEETKQFAKLILQVAKNLGIAIRVGYQDYLNNGQTFIHVDVCPEYYAKGKPRFAHPHPTAWEMPYKIW